MERNVLAYDQFWNDVRGKLTENQRKWVHYFIITGISLNEIIVLGGVSADAVQRWGREVQLL